MGPRGLRYLGQPGWLVGGSDILAAFRVAVSLFGLCGDNRRVTSLLGLGQIRFPTQAFVPFCLGKKKLRPGLTYYRPVGPVPRYLEAIRNEIRDDERREAAKDRLVSLGSEIPRLSVAQNFIPVHRADARMCCIGRTVFLRTSRGNAAPSNACASLREREFSPFTYFDLLSDSVDHVWFLPAGALNAFIFWSS